MKKSIIVVIFVGIFFAVILYAKFTGLVVTSLNTCMDTDGKDFSSKGEVYGVYYLFTKENYTLQDYCADDIALIEYYCVQDGIHSYRESIKYNCELGCLDGACKTGLPVDTLEMPAPPAKSSFEKFMDRIRGALGI